MIHHVLIMAMKCYGGQSLISAWSLKGNLIPLQKHGEYINVLFLNGTKILRLYL